MKKSLLHGMMTLAAVALTAFGAQAHTITVDDAITNGTVTVDKTSADKDATVTITITPAEGYELNELKVCDNDQITIGIGGG